jgi:hypothetical protein
MRLPIQSRPVDRTPLGREPQGREISIPASTAIQPSVRCKDWTDCGAWQRCIDGWCERISLGGGS